VKPCGWKGNYSDSHYIQLDEQAVAEIIKWT